CFAGGQSDAIERRLDRQVWFAWPWLPARSSHRNIARLRDRRPKSHPEAGSCWQVPDRSHPDRVTIVEPLRRCDRSLPRGGAGFHALTTSGGSGDSTARKRGQNLLNGKPHHVVAGSVDSGNEASAHALNSIRAGLVEWLAAGDIGADFGLGHRAKKNLALHRFGFDQAAAVGDREGGYDHVPAACEDRH